MLRLGNLKQTRFILINIVWNIFCLANKVLANIPSAGGIIRNGAS